MRRHHDMGGLPAGAIAMEALSHAPWEKRVAALLNVLARGAHPVMTVDEMRRAIEDLGAAEYDRLGYYERWITAITRVLIERGVLTVDALARKLAELEARRAAPAR
jgi:nitrile hydratase subunit beta